MFRYFVKWSREKLSQHGELYKYRLSIIYAVLAWNVTIYSIHLLLSPDCDLNNEEEKKKYVDKLTEKKAEVHIIKVKGLKTESSEVRINPENLPEDRESLND